MENPVRKCTHAKFKRRNIKHELPKRNTYMILYSATLYSQGSQAGLLVQEIKTLTEPWWNTGFNFLDRKYKRRL